jgi:hypothetical protein
MDANPAVAVMLARLQPRQLRLERGAQLGGFVIGQPVRHLGKDRTVKPDALRPPRHLLRRPRLGKNLMEFGANLIGIGPIDRRGTILEHIVRLIAVERVQLIFASHVIVPAGANQGIMTQTGNPRDAYIAVIPEVKMGGSGADFDPTTAVDPTAVEVIGTIRAPATNQGRGSGRRVATLLPKLEQDHRQRRTCHPTPSPSCNSIRTAPLSLLN